MTSRKKPRKITERSIENAALFYLQRFATSAENLKRVLMRKVYRAERAQGAGPDDTVEDGAVKGSAVKDGADIVESVIGRLLRAGLLDDQKYAESHAVMLHRRGMSAGRIRGKLVQKGLDAEAAGHALAALAAETASDPAGVELAGAVNLARRRRLGPFRSPADRPRMREKDLAALARAGFSYPLAVKVIDAACPDTLPDTPS